MTRECFGVVPIPVLPADIGYLEIHESPGKAAERPGVPEHIRALSSTDVLALEADIVAG